jgi:osmotically-inducible protein OsmY
MTQTYSDLASNLSVTLELDERTGDSQIEVIDNNGVITLSGVALSNDARSAAAEIAQGFPGVLSVINDIAVTDPDNTDEPRVIVPMPFNRQ